MFRHEIKDIKCVKFDIGLLTQLKPPPVSFLERNQNDLSTLLRVSVGVRWNLNETKYNVRRIRIKNISQTSQFSIFVLILVRQFSALGKIFLSMFPPLSLQHKSTNSGMFPWWKNRNIIVGSIRLSLSSFESVCERDKTWKSFSRAGLWKMREREEFFPFLMFNF